MSELPDVATLAELPCYLEEEAAPPRPGDVRAAALKRWAVALVDRPVGDDGGAAAKPFQVPSRLASSACFFRVVDVPGRELARVMPEWWARHEHDGWVNVGRELRLAEMDAAEAEAAAAGVWSMRGRLWRGSLWPPTPVVIELWPHNSLWSGMSLRPGIRVVPSRRYFRTGHAGLDQLKRDLISAQVRTGPSTSRAPSSARPSPPG